MSCTKLAQLRTLLKKHSLSAYIIPTADAHQSEYVAECDNRRAYISGFDGSAGTALVCEDQALLWTDGRYFLQAEKQLDAANWKLMKAGMDNVPSLDKWLSLNLPLGSNVGFNPLFLSISQYKTYDETLKSSGINLVPITEDLVDAVWADKPAIPEGKIIALPVSSTGKSVADKLAFLRQKMVENKCYAIVLCALDEIAWTLNLRGSDIAFNPVFFSYFVLTLESASVYVVNPKNIPADAELTDVTVKPYSEIMSDLANLSKIVTARKENKEVFKIWYDSSKSNTAIPTALALDDSFINETATPVTLAKALKTPEEAKGMRDAHVRDGVAMVRFLSWLENEAKFFPGQGTESPYNEFTLASKLEEFRKLGDKYVSLSFGTISSIGPNGAIIHYSPSETKSAPIITGNIYLLDSGAQYLDGTTDITRTVYLPSAERPVPTEEQMKTYTLVLMGHICLAQTPFPSGTMGPALDALARQYLWAHGLNFLHGTGHGVGHFLNVHEGPQGIAMMNRGGAMCRTPLAPGMIISNEPGYYKDGEYGIRIESLVEVVPKKVQGTDCLGFDTITMCPIDLSLVNKDLMQPQHIEWLNNYHKQVRETLSPLLANEPEVLAWVEKSTRPL